MIANYWDDRPNAYIPAENRFRIQVIEGGRRWTKAQFPLLRVVSAARPCALISIQDRLSNSSIFTPRERRRVGSEVASLMIPRLSRKQSVDLLLDLPNLTSVIVGADRRNLTNLTEITKTKNAKIDKIGVFSVYRVFVKEKMITWASLDQ